MSIMRLEPRIAQTIFYSLLFAIGGAPTIAMAIIYYRQISNELMMTAFISLTTVLACVLVPLIIIQNSYLLLRRNNSRVNERIRPLLSFYLILNIICLIFWIALVLI